MTKSEKDISREAWVIAQALKSAVLIADACYCGTESDDVLSKRKFNDIITDLALELSSNQLENLRDILENALAKKEKLDRYFYKDLDD